ncbi:MAG: protein kinase domain-containing protein [Nostoc sp. SerVER01]|nr:GUN4 domain-containing protein [Nostoc sp. SerVER01]
MLYCSNPSCSNPFNPDDNKFCIKCGQTLTQLFRNRFRVIRLFGEGGFSRTYEARDADRIDEPCVIKQFVPQVQGTTALEKATELFKQEAKRLYHLGEHPQIPRLIAYFEQDQRLYLVQELIEGQNLLEELQQQGAFSEEKIKQLLVDLLPVLKFIHERGVIHRDIKPENIMRRCQDGKLILIDFGVSKQITATALGVGTTVGTPGYAPIEQMRGQVFPASDLYSLGVTCIRLLTQCLPKADGSDELYDALRGCWIWIKYLPQGKSITPECGSVLDKLIQDYVKERYQSADEVLADICNISKPILDIDRKLINISILGTWCGNFGNKYKFATLIVEHYSSQSSFNGTLTVRDLRYGTSRLEIRGDFNRERNQVTLNETKVVLEPWLGYWSLGQNQGTLSKDAQKISGKGQDARESLYLWAFVKLDYTHLTDLLAAKNWQEADRETGTIMLKIACREEKNYLSSSAIKNFSSQNLRMINNLWVNYSNGHFGYIVQKRIWENLTYDWKKVGNRLGWRVNNRWKQYSELTFSINAPEGAFPTFWGGEGRKLIFGYSGAWEDFFSLVRACKL